MCDCLFCMLCYDVLCFVLFRCVCVVLCCVFGYVFRCLTVVAMCVSVRVCVFVIVCCFVLLLHLYYDDCVCVMFVNVVCAGFVCPRVVS